MKVFVCLAKVLVMATIAVFVGGISGCATGPQAKTLSTNTVLNKKLTVRKLDFSGDAIKPEDVKKSIADALVASGNQPTTYNETSRNDEYGTTWETDGIKSNVGGNGIKVEYLNGGKRTTNYGMTSYIQSHIFAEFPLSLNDNGDYYEALLTFPSQINLEPAEFNPFSKPKYLLADEEIVPNLLSKFKELNNDKIAIKRFNVITGEISVEFNPDSIYANYERKLGKQYSSNKGQYDFDYAGEKLRLSVDIHPYRNGAKVMYRMIVPYFVSDKISITQTDINNIKTKIEAIARD